ncbi:MmgE/PrpD family protein [Bradyrhizobium commune]|uniref:MmgE/PrpD family protein n=1 Tax=Bradyrhizobium commune TaxID=83627 RepID=A0A7S9D458_9BRAD|nr:MmgE/PrpD family protein [Bradyrhizobium commune]QPF90723.1 MmgE/PrpD family protein [Bradyrhizobium commune]
MDASNGANATSSIGEIVDRIVELRRKPAPENVVQLARHCLLDWIGVALAAANDPVIEKLRGAVASSSNGFTLVGTRERTSLDAALLINGAAGHILDFDDVHAAVPGHVTVAIAPVVLTLAEVGKGTWNDLITAFVAGYEGMCALSRLMGPAHPRKGFHATATMGTFGAAIAASSFMSASRTETLSAIAIAATQAAGLRAAFGTPLKSIQVGRASVNGHLSATLAMSGLSAPETVFSGIDGFALTHEGGPEQPHAAERGYFIPDTVFKYDASCFVTHAPIECARKARETMPIPFESVSKIEVRIHPHAERICAIRYPKTFLQAKFSLHHTVAMTLLGISTGNLANFEDYISDPDIESWRQKVELLYDGKVGETASFVRVILNDGAAKEFSCDSNKPETNLALQEERLASKFMTLASPILGDDQASEICRTVLRCDRKASVGTLFSLLRPQG